MPKTFKIQAQKTEQKIALNHLELFYLRLHTHGLSSKEISKFLELEVKKINYIRYGLKQKYNCKSWVKLITKAFEKHHLNKLDFIENEVKEEALKQTSLFYTNYLNASYSGNSTTTLKQQILEFYYLCEVSINNAYDKKSIKDKLNTLEVTFIKLKHQGLEPNDILKQLDISETKLDSLKRSIHIKLKTNNWFNVYRKALQLNLLDKPIDHFLGIEKRINNTANKILQLKTLNRLQPNEKKLIVYNELLYLYSNIEFNNLLNNNLENGKNI